MDESHTIPLLGPDVRDLPPRALRQALRSGEQLLWWGRGGGWTFDSTAVVQTVWILVVAIAALFIPNGGPFPALALSLGGGAMILWRLVIGGRYQTYGLTHDRVIRIGLIPPAISADRDGRHGGAIHLLRVSGRRERGDVRLQSGLVSHTMGRRPGVCLIGIDNPLDVAALIGATLNLGIPVEDRTR